MLKIGNDPVDNIFIGSEEVDAIYLGDNLVWKRVRASVLTSGSYDWMGVYDPEWGANDWYYRRGFFTSAIGVGPHGSLVPQELAETTCLGLYNFTTQFYGDQGSYLVLSGNIAAGSKAVVMARATLSQR